MGFRALQFVQKICPWFSYLRTLDLDVWERVGVDLRAWISEHKGEEVPIPDFPLWGVVHTPMTHAKEDISLSPEFHSYQKKSLRIL